MRRLSVVDDRWMREDDEEIVIAKPEQVSMYERFTDRARRAIKFSQATAYSARSPEIRTGHLLVGLMREGGVPAHVLREAGLDERTIRRALPRYETVDAALVPASPGPSVEAQQVLSRALRQALSMGDADVGTEHLLLGMLTMTTDGGLAVLAPREEALRLELQRRLRGPAEAPVAKPAPAAIEIALGIVDEWRRRWESDEPRWHFVLETLWTQDYEWVVRFLNDASSLDEAVRRCEALRDGMVAT